MSFAAPFLTISNESVGQNVLSFIIYQVLNVSPTTGCFSGFSAFFDYANLCCVWDLEASFLSQVVEEELVQLTSKGTVFSSSLAISLKTL